MAFALEMARSLLPLVIVGGIAVFVVKRMERKYKKGSLGINVNINMYKNARFSMYEITRFLAGDVA